MLRMFSNLAKSTQLKWKGVKLLCFLYPSSMTSWLGDWSNVFHRIITMVRYNIWEREKERIWMYVSMFAFDQYMFGKKDHISQSMWFRVLHLLGPLGRFRHGHMIKAHNQNQTKQKSRAFSNGGHKRLYKPEAIRGHFSHQKDRDWFRMNPT